MYLDEVVVKVVDEDVCKLLCLYCHLVVADENLKIKNEKEKLIEGLMG